MKSITHIQRPKDQPGFLGRGHVARPVITLPFSQSDPFIMLMDDILDKQDDIPVGGPHPHAGFETVTLLLEGEMGDGEHIMRAGDFQMMTAGSGIVHTETISKQTRMRLLQLWLTLPPQERWAQPRLQELSAANVPTVTVDGVQIKLYSGKAFGLASPVQNHTPFLLMELSWQEDGALDVPVPADYNGFIYAIDGGALAGAEFLEQDHVGWLSRDTSEESIRLEPQAGTRLVLYAAQPQGVPIVSHGPFIGDTQEDILRLYQDFRRGKMGHINEVDPALKLQY